MNWLTGQNLCLLSETRVETLDHYPHKVIDIYKGGKRARELKKGIIEIKNYLKTNCMVFSTIHAPIFVVAFILLAIGASLSHIDPPSQSPTDRPTNQKK